MISSSVNLLRFVSVSFNGERANLKMPTFQGSRSRGRHFAHRVAKR